MGRHPGRIFGAIAQTIWRTAFAIFRKGVGAAARYVGAVFLEFAAPEVAGVVNGRKTLNTAGRV